MKRNEIKKLHSKTIPDLQKDLGEAREDLRKLKFDLSAGKVKNIQKIRESKKRIARVLTFIDIKSRQKSTG
ncbi:MAG: 50S ribosomal protein L29 [Candidatus Colwellbacteria bacterium RBG_13_48_8]|uniref:Large ribosomal subunit protein uL29 n=1 Tax=Candidatus Colwellbacteria bacterium RBG_13_48_8 TaxID=1797685 RepID=A0A1G1YXG9_9BACT|nr:MAG: 50S ribosomal protein L29 [Candidatus Colwellbacteria bacterium RBG_13_48_8]